MNVSHLMNVSKENVILFWRADLVEPVVIIIIIAEMDEMVVVVIKFLVICGQ